MDSTARAESATPATRPAHLVSLTTQSALAVLLASHCIMGNVFLIVLLGIIWMTMEDVERATRPARPAWVLCCLSAPPVQVSSASSTVSVWRSVGRGSMLRTPPVTIATLPAAHASARCPPTASPAPNRRRSSSVRMLCIMASARPCVRNTPSWITHAPAQSATRPARCVQGRLLRTALPVPPPSTCTRDAVSSPVHRCSSVRTDSVTRVTRHVSHVRVRLRPTVLPAPPSPLC